MEQWIQNAESMGSISGLSKAICELLTSNIQVLSAPCTGGMRERAMASRVACTLKSIDLAISALQRLKVLVAKEAVEAVGDG